MATPDDMEAQFYEAMQQGDLERLMAVWADDEDIVCVHPGGMRVYGQAGVRASFDEMFSQGAIDTRPTRVRRVQTGTCAIHHVLEQIRLTTPAGLENGYIVATNVYVKTLQGWRMLVHHASPGSRQEQEEGNEVAGPLLH